MSGEAAFATLGETLAALAAAVARGAALLDSTAAAAAGKNSLDCLSPLSASATPPSPALAAAALPATILAALLAAPPTLLAWPSKIALTVAPVLAASAHSGVARSALVEIFARGVDVISRGVTNSMSRSRIVAGARAAALLRAAPAGRVEDGVSAVALVALATPEATATSGDSEGSTLFAALRGEAWALLAKDKNNALAVAVCAALPVIGAACTLPAADAVRAALGVAAASNAALGPLILAAASQHAARGCVIAHLLPPLAAPSVSTVHKLLPAVADSLPGLLAEGVWSHAAAGTTLCASLTLALRAPGEVQNLVSLATTAEAGGAAAAAIRARGAATAAAIDVAASCVKIISVLAAVPPVVENASSASLETALADAVRLVGSVRLWAALGGPNAEAAGQGPAALAARCSIAAALFDVAAAQRGSSAAAAAPAARVALARLAPTAAVLRSLAKRESLDSGVSGKKQSASTVTATTMTPFIPPTGDARAWLARAAVYGDVCAALAPSASSVSSSFGDDGASALPLVLHALSLVLRVAAGGDDNMGIASDEGGVVDARAYAEQALAAAAAPLARAAALRAAESGLAGEAARSALDAADAGAALALARSPSATSAARADALVCLASLAPRAPARLVPPLLALACAAGGGGGGGFKLKRTARRCLFFRSLGAPR